jgi:predicted RND superfamily exporter protein
LRVAQTELVGRMHTVFTWIIRFRLGVVAIVLAVTAFLASFLFPVEQIKFDYSFKRLFLSHGGSQDDLREFQQDYGDDVGLVSILFVLPNSGQKIDDRTITGTVFEPKVVRSLKTFTDALGGADEIEGERVFSLIQLANLHGSVQLNFVMTALTDLEAACEQEEGWNATRAVAVVESRGPPTETVPDRLVKAVEAYQEAKAMLLRHRLYVRSVFNDNATSTGVIARFGNEYVHDAQRKAILNGLSKPERLSPEDAERLASIRLADVLQSMPDGTEVFVSGMPVIQKSYTDITLEDMSTYVPLISLAMALLLFLLFRTFWATVFPMVGVGFATVWSIGFMQWQGEPITVINSVIPVLVLVIGVADAIHIISRYLQIASKTENREEAIVETMVHMAPPCLLAALTTAVGFASLLAANIPSIRSFGVYSAYAILFAFIMQMTLLPIGLSLVRKPTTESVHKPVKKPGARFFDWVILVVLGRPRTILLIAGAVMVTSIFGVIQVSDESRILEELSPEHPVSKALEQTEAHLTGVLVHAIAFQGKAYEDKRCAVDSDCVEESCDKAKCPTPGCCSTQVCKVVDRTRKLTSQLRANLADLSGADQVSLFDELETALRRQRSVGATPHVVQAKVGKRSVGHSKKDDEDTIALEDEDEIVLEDEDEIVIEDEAAEPSEVAVGSAAKTVAGLKPKKTGICIESFKNAAMIQAVSKLDDWISQSPEHAPMISRVSSITDILREMHLAIVGPDDPANYRIPESINRRQVEELLKELKGDPGNIVGRVMTDDFTRGNITIRANDEGTEAWANLEADLNIKLKELIADNPELAGKFDYHITGSSTLAHGALHSIINDMSTSIGLAFLFIWILISVLFRSVRVGFIAMVPNIWPLLITLAFMGYAGMSLRISSVIIFTISLGIAVDDTIHYLARLREEARRGLSLEDVIKNTTRGTGRAVVLTTIILVTGLSVNGFSEFIAMEQFGLLSAFTLATALVGVLFLLPVLVQVFRVDKKLV